MIVDRLRRRFLDASRHVVYSTDGWSLDEGAGFLRSIDTPWLAWLFALAISYIVIEGGCPGGNSKRLNSNIFYGDSKPLATPWRYLSVASRLSKRYEREIWIAYGRPARYGSL
jgi:hypothetical protein